MSVSAFPQIINQVKINWDENPRRLDEIEYLYFYGGVYNNDDLIIPSFNINIPTKKGMASEFKIQNPIFETVNNGFVNYESYKNMVNSTIEIKYSELFHRNEKLVNVNFYPFRINASTGKLEKLVSFNYTVNEVEKPEVDNKSLKTYAANSVLSSGKWVKIKIENDGIYKLTYSDLVDMGFQNPQNIRVFGNGGEMLPENSSKYRHDDLVENSIYMDKGIDNVFNTNDYILFYGVDVNGWNYDDDENRFEHSKNIYSTNSYYFLTTDVGVGKKISLADLISDEVNHTTRTFDHYDYYEDDSDNLLLSGQLWVGEHFDAVTTYDFDFNIPNIDVSSKVNLTYYLLARSSVSSYFNITANDLPIKTVTVGLVNMSSYTATYASYQYNNVLFDATSSDINISIDYTKTTSLSEGWLNYLEINSRRFLNMNGGQMKFRDIKTVGKDNVTEFVLSAANSNIIIWDITEPLNPLIVDGSIDGDSLRFIARTDSLKEFIAFQKDGNFLTPTVVGNITNQNLHGLQQADMYIITHPLFINSALELEALHEQNDNLTVETVTTEQVYNEFSSGQNDVCAIRDFMKMFFDRSTGEEDMPKYLMLFGDGSYDNFTNSSSNTNFITTYQSSNSLTPTSSFVTDDFYGLLNEGESVTTGALDIGVGRLPVKNSTEANSVVNKIKNYIQTKTYDDWRNIITFVADDEDSAEHMDNADALTVKIDSLYPVYNIEKIYLDAYQQVTTPSGERYPDVNTAINNRMKKGALIVNYIGHGNELGLAHEHILGINDINNWSNFNQLPIFMTATCEFSRFDDFERTSAGEQILLNPNGGGIALLTTTRLVYSSPNFALNDKFYNYVVAKDENNEPYRLGDIMRLTKINSGAGTNKLNFTLLGDPALQPAIPTYGTNTLSINGTIDSLDTDTINALSKVTITGEVVDDDGVLMADYNGELNISVYDKESTITTLANDGAGAITYKSLNNIIYKGNATIINGLFTFSFIVPKDIAYNYGFGKVSYYYKNETVDGHGYFDEILIGGSSDSIDIDENPPVIELYMNDESFVFGGLTNQSPIMYAKVFDDNGINTVGSGIGHDITAVIDDNTSQIIVLNDYYESEIDSYQSGNVKYPFADLSNGMHNIRFKAWDTHNNSSEAYLEFIVAESSEMILEHLFNYPNPFTTSTSFFFDHNSSETELDVIIQIFSISGKLVKTIEEQIFSSGYRVGPITWNGLDDYGGRLGRGVYFYKVNVRTSTGQLVEKIEKLVILK
ncbi:MAG: hypothetical protein A2W98_02095 [Bacteroidetes bacterium GWF2_33_38]|nr:MAG: hypothetical protein A2W98_02095 [Bacteroidetes bacterium GWF2_33_38]OFY74248.1 MAG: hypothetical protein A2265_01700 [Bacteroidetes bacterium RIFOXYA12_FULL_33_9]